MDFAHHYSFEGLFIFNQTMDLGFKTDGASYQNDDTLLHEQPWHYQLDYSSTGVPGSPELYAPLSPPESTAFSEESYDPHSEKDQLISPHPYGLTPDIMRCNNSVFTLDSSSCWGALSLNNMAYPIPNLQVAPMAAMQGEPDTTQIDANYEEEDQVNFHTNFTGQSGPGIEGTTIEFQSYPQSLVNETKTSPSTEEEEEEEEDEGSSFPTSAFETSIDEANDPDYSPSRRPIKTIKRASYSARPTARGQHVLSVRSAGITKSKAVPRHIPSTSCTNYPCVFRWAGCGSIFISKNEWKRHVSTQHLGLQYWQCRLGTCGEQTTGKNGKEKKCKNDSHIFNRKDLFTQHIRRQHVPAALKNVATKGNQGSVEDRNRLKDWEKKVQEAALFVQRQPLNDSTCPIRGCKQSFMGKKGWDDRMEHLGQHAQKGECKGQDLGTGGLREWALDTGVVDHLNGDWRFLDGNAKVMSCEEDAEGEDE